ncbi:hypothetical protein [Nostoc sp. C110]|uniref:hypothetical protein n=1 Tax=Nostoc sp. C110 TaxID=3349876 RepID=UPI00370D8A94
MWEDGEEVLPPKVTDSPCIYATPLADTQVGCLKSDRTHCLDNRRSVNICCKRHKAKINSLYESDRSCHRILLREKVAFPKRDR